MRVVAKLPKNTPYFSVFARFLGFGCKIEKNLASELQKVAHFSVCGGAPGRFLGQKLNHSSGEK